MGPDDAVYVTAPTLAAYDSVYKVTLDGEVTSIEAGFGRPQGIAFDRDGAALVIEALAGASGLYRLRPSRAPELLLSGPALVGIAVDPFGGMIVCSNETAYRMPPPRR
jgi:hypothetical protein